MSDLSAMSDREAATQLVDEAIAVGVAARKPFIQRKKVRKFSLGVIEKITANVLFALMTVAFGAGAVYLTQQVTAAPTVYVDAVTGCQYLTTSAGITPRMNAAGTQLCGEAQ